MLFHSNKHLTFLAVFLVLGSAFIVHAETEDACKAAKALRSERLSTDATLRRTRADLNQRILTTKLQMNDLDRKIATIEDDLVKASSTSRDALWSEYDKLGDERDKLATSIKPIQKEYQATIEARTTKRIELKKAMLAKQYECAMNEPLTKALAKLEAKLHRTNQLNADERSAIIDLTKQRSEKLEQLKRAYQNYIQQIDVKETEQRQMQTVLDEITKKEESTDRSIENGYNEITATFNQMNDLIEKTSEETSGISERLMRHLSDKK